MQVRIIFTSDYRKQTYATLESLNDLETLVNKLKTSIVKYVSVEIEFHIFSSEDILLTVNDS